MYVEIPVTEVLALAAAREPLPPMVRSVRAEGSTIHADVDLNAIPDAPTALRWAAMALGTVSVSATFTGYAEGVASLRVTVHARSLPAHVFINPLVGPINDALKQRGLPDGLVQLRRGESEPVVLVGVQSAVDAKAKGVTITDVDLRDATARVRATIGAVAF